MNAPLTMNQAVRWVDRLDASSAFTYRALFFILAHIPLALLLKQSRLLATAHALIVLAYGLHYATKRRKIAQLACVVAYIGGAELLWRMSRAHVFWEYSKYAAAFLMLLSLIRYPGRRLPRLPIIYIALLIPSCLQVLDRRAISFNMSGPLSLAVATVFFSRLQLSPSQLRRVLISLIAPIVGTVSLATFSTIQAGSKTAIGMNKATSGGIGPNQMSSLLGLGALAAFAYLFCHRRNRQLRLVMAVLLVWLISQCALTYSRGGLWSALIAMATFGFFLLRSRRDRISLLLGGVVFALLAQFVLLPTLDRVAQGTLIPRLQDIDPTGRDERAVAEWETFKESPILGVGPGQPRLGGTYEMTAHTEFTRLLAEHGSFGLVSLILLSVMGLQRLGPGRRSPSTLDRAFAVSFAGWTYLTMGHAAMRLFAPGLVFGLAAMKILPEELMFPRPEGAQQPRPAGADADEPRPR